MRIALLGYGKMGQMVEKLALEKGDIITSIGKNKETPLNLKEADVIIDFSSSDAVISHVHLAGQAKKNIVIGTTGWDPLLPEVKDLVKKYEIGALYSPNFSIGVHLFIKLAKEASALFAKEKGYCAAGVEIHHEAKKDAPSGTAKAISQVIQKNHPEKKEFASIRTGHIPGTHTLYFDSIEDTITITHTAKGREGFASGALFCAKWLNDKKGFFTLEDLL